MFPTAATMSGSRLEATEASGQEQFPHGDVTDASADYVFPDSMPESWRQQDMEARIGRLEEERDLYAKLFPVQRHDVAWFSEADKELLGLTQEASRPNWDEDGSLPVSPIAWQTAQRLIRLLEPYTTKPALGVGRKGQITLDWWGPRDQSVTAEVHSDGRVVYAALIKNSPVRGTVTVPSDATIPPPALHLALALAHRAGDDQRQ